LLHAPTGKSKNRRIEEPKADVLDEDSPAAASGRRSERPSRSKHERRLDSSGARVFDLGGRSAAQSAVGES
jgi:hypothetical protein